MVEPSKGAVSKAKIGPKPGPLCQAVNRVVNAKKMFLKELKCATPANAQEIGKQNSPTAERRKVVVVWIEEQTSDSIPVS